MQAFMERASETLERLKVNPDTGLTQQQVQENRQQYGENQFTREKPDSFVKRLLESAKEPMTIMLIAAAIITLGVNIVRAATGGEADFLECLGIFIAIALSVSITVIMEGRSAKAFEALSQMGEDIQVKVIRDGEIQLIAQKDLVVGDILYVETGNKLPADGRLLESTDLMSDESALTGESMPVKKDAAAVFETEKTPVAERTNLLYSGCFITGGNGRMVVTAVGDHTEFGKIAQALSDTSKSSTPLQEKLAMLGKRIAILGATVAAIVFLVQLIRFIAAGTASLLTVTDAFITSIVLIVASVPEGLPTIVAVSLALNIIKMSKQNALVKKMVACETIGCINVICSDKTGTLTENRMTVTDIYDHGALHGPEQLQNRDLIQNFCINSTADVHFEQNQPSFIGNPTECALLTAAHKSGIDYTAVRSGAEVLHVFPFSSETKNMTTVVAAGDGVMVYSKGSPEKIIAMCKMEPEEKAQAEAEILRFQSQAGRVIGFAHKQTPRFQDFEAHRAELEADLVFDGFVSIKDPLRADVYEAVAKCRSAGIDLKMLTGDNIVTATAIANDLHLLDEGHIAVEAKDLEGLSDEEFLEKIPTIRVIARSTPSVKMRVVNALKSLGNVVAVTGDGINDAPAIKNADVGIAMGITGTEVSKEASDIVLLDDSFSTIVTAVHWGRGIYENFQRFIQFQLTVNLSSVIVVLVSVLVGFPAPFTALELLWINLIMDGPPALTLGLEPIRDNLMDRAPTRRDASIVSRGMLTRIVVNGLYISLIFMLQHFTNFLGGTEAQMSTILFSLFVVFQLFNALNSRELSSTSIFRNLLRNRMLLGVFALTFLLQVFITQVGGAFFGTVPLPLAMWGKIIATGFTVILLSEIVKFFQRLAARR